jgi:hypothetical protein
MWQRLVINTRRYDVLLRLMITPSNVTFLTLVYEE